VNDDAPEMPLLLTMQQVADMCQVSLATVREWTYLPGFPVIRRPRQVRIHARLLDAWLTGQAMSKEGAA
jgi:hypothetical protein